MGIICRLQIDLCLCFISQYYSVCIRGPCLKSSGNDAMINIEVASFLVLEKGHSIFFVCECYLANDISRTAEDIASFTT